MSMSINLHPNTKWNRVSAVFYGKGQGECVDILLHGENGDSADLALHFGHFEYAQEFVDKLKIAILSLPVIVGKE